MSTNVSLTNAGTSLHFDGQDLQTQQEAEMDREEQLQQNELRQLLSNAFDDLEDDILSVASSEDDSINNSHMSSRHHDMSAHHSHQNSLPAERTANSTGINNIIISGSGGGGVMNSVPAVVSSGVMAGPTASPSSLPHFRPSPSLRASQEGSLGTVPRGSPAPSHSDRFPWTQVYGGGGGGGGNPWTKGEGGGVYTTTTTAAGQEDDDGWGGRMGDVVGEEELPQHDVVDGLQPSPSLSLSLLSSSGALYGATSAYPYAAATYTTAAVATTSAGSQSSLPYAHSPGGHFLPAGRDGGAQYWSQDTYHSLPTSHANNSNTNGDTGDGFPFGSSSGGGGFDPQRQHDTASTFNTVQGWSTAPQSKGSATHPLPFSQPNAATEAGGVSYSGYPPGMSNSYSNTGWNPASGGSNQGRDSTTNSSYPVYSAAPSSSAGWEGGGSGGGRQGGGGVERKAAAAGQAGRMEEEERGESYDDRYTVSYVKRRPPATAVVASGHELKVNFMAQEGDNEEASRLQQLQMLYQARGRQVEDLRTELDTLTQESAKERRMLKHLLSVASGEKEGMEKSLKQCQQLLAEAREEQGQTTTQLTTAQAQLKALTNSKDEVVMKLQSAETTIETLSHQVAGLQGVDSLTQARRQHEAVVSSLHQRFDAQLLDLRQQLDQATATLTTKSEEVGRLEDQVRDQRQRAEHATISRGDTVNQLTRSLEESQQRCQALLNAASGDESSKLRTQLQQALMSKKMSDDMCSSLQSEVQDVKEQLHLLESATSLGALSHSQGAMNDSIADLGIRKTLDFSTADTSARYESGQSSEELVVKLRHELERCVVSNRQKRQQVGELTQTTRRLTGDAQLLQQQLTEAQETLQAQKVKLTSYEERLGGSLQPSAVEGRLKRDLENLQLEYKALLRDVEDYKSRVKEMSANEEQLSEINDQLKQQMVAMVTQHDQDMRQAMDRCRQSSEEGHLLSRQKLEHQLRSQLFADKQELIMKYEGQLSSAREELQRAQEELDKIKDMYVQTGRDLTQAQEALQNRDEELQDSIASEKSKWESEREVAMETVWQQRLEKARSQWEAEKEAESQHDWQRRLETERQKWEAESQQRAERDWQQRLETERVKWEAEREAGSEAEWQKRLETERVKWEAERETERVKWEAERETEQRNWKSQNQKEAEEGWQRRLEQERQTWESERGAELNLQWQQRLEKEKRAWDSEKRAGLESEWKERLEREQRSWQVRTDREALEQTDMAVSTARRKWQQETQEELKALTQQLEKCRLQHQAELLALEAKWREEVGEKERAMDGRLQSSLEGELSQKLAQQRATLTEQAQHTLQHELRKQDERHREESERRVREEKERVEADIRHQTEREKQAAVEAAFRERQTQQQHDTDRNVQEEAAKWKEEIQRLQGELARQAERWGAERGRLVAEKDEERREAVQGARSEGQSDLERVTEESRATLDSALQAARQHHHRQMGETEARYKQELSALRTVEQELRHALSATTTPTTTTTTPSPEDDQNPNQDPSSSVSAAALRKEAERLRKEGERLRKEVEKREGLLRKADSHMSAEVERLKGALQEGYSQQREKDAQRLREQYARAMGINQRERTRLERQVELLEEQLNRQSSNPRPDMERDEEKAEELVLLREERDRLASETQRLEEERERLEEERERLEEKRERLEEALRVEEESRERLQQEQEDVCHKLQQQVSTLMADKESLSRHLRECQTALRSLTQETQRKGEQQDKQVAALKQRLEQTWGRGQQLQGALKAVTRQHQQDLEVVHQAHQQKLAALNDRLDQAEKQHSAALEELQQQHKRQRAALAEEMGEQHRAEQRALEADLERRHQKDTTSMMQEFTRQAHRALADTPSQTESEDSLCQLKDQYLHAVQNIKDQVMSHIEMSNGRAASAMKVEIRHERLRTIQHLRGRCKSRLRNLLQSHLERLQNPDLWWLIDQALDSLFDTVGSSRSATPGTSNPITPRSSEEDDDPSSPHRRTAPTPTMHHQGDTHIGDISDDRGDGVIVSDDRGDGVIVSNDRGDGVIVSDVRGGERGGGSNNNTSVGSAQTSTPQSVGSERYALPWALESAPQRYPGSLEDLQEATSGVFYSLLPDDTASVTDSELEFKVPTHPALRKAAPAGTGSRRSAFHASTTTRSGGGGGGGTEWRKTRSTPPKGKRDLSVFVGVGGGEVSSPPLHHSPALLSPKLHRGGEGEEGRKGGVWRRRTVSPKGKKDEGDREREDDGEKEEESGGGWKEVDGEGWVAAVGGSNLWQAFSDLQTLESGGEEGGREPRRQLRFSSQSLADTDDSDVSLADSVVEAEVPSYQRRRDLNSSHHHSQGRDVADRRGNSGLSRSMDLSAAVKDQGLSRLLASAGGRQQQQRASPGRENPQQLSQHSSPLQPRRQTSTSYPDLAPRERDVVDSTPTGRKTTTRTLPSRRRCPQPATRGGGLSLPADAHVASASASSQHAQFTNAAVSSSKLLLDPKDFLSQPVGGKKSSMSTSSSSSTKVLKTSPGDGRGKEDWRQGGRALNTSAAERDKAEWEEEKRKKRRSEAPERLGGEGGEEEEGGVGSGLETLHSMLERLGISNVTSQQPHRHNRHHHASPQKKTLSGRDRAAGEDSFTHASSSSSSFTSNLNSSTQKLSRHPDSQSGKTRTRSADDVSLKQQQQKREEVEESLGSRQAHRGSAVKLSVFSPPLSSQTPVHHQADRGQHRLSGGGGRRKEGNPVVQRSLEDLHLHQSPTHGGSGVFAHESRLKWHSEQALHVLSEAFGDRDGEVGGEEYSYTPLKHLLPPPSPSTSLLSTYSVSEGDLRQLPQHLAFSGARF